MGGTGRGINAQYQGHCVNDALFVPQGGSPIALKEYPSNMNLKVRLQTVDGV